MKQEIQQALQLIEASLMRSVGDANYHANWQAAIKIVTDELNKKETEKDK
ncbi:MAG: hypothetical protein H6743_03825 [Rickettsiaceae bacterium]|nr:hypothetical protein [Rickettsiaceae bacterium]